MFATLHQIILYCVAVLSNHIILCGWVALQLHTLSLFTWRISLWPNCGFWSIVAFYLLSHTWDCGFEWPCWRGGPEIKNHNGFLWLCSADVGCWCQVPICMQLGAGQGDVTTNCMLWVFWRFRCQRLPAPALISPLIDYVPRWIALLCLVVCIARRCQIVSSFVPGGCCVTLQMLMRAGVLSWIKPGERFCSSLGSVMTSMSLWYDICIPLELVQK